MKKLLITFIALCLTLSCLGQIRFNITIADPVTGKRIKYTSTEVRVQYGVPIEFIGIISFHESNDDPATPLGPTTQAKRVVESYMESFTTLDKHIDPLTKVYVASDAVGAVQLGAYLANKALNSLPGVSGSDSWLIGAEGLCKEMISVRKANGEFVN